jgi:hypothetical protein
VYRSKHVTMGGTTQKIERNFYRASKALSAIYNDFKIHGMTYEAVRDGSSYDESIMVNEIDGSIIASVVSYSHKRMMDYKIENTTVGNIFSNNFAAELNKIHYGYRPSLSEVEQPKVSSVGENFIEAKPNGSNMEIRYSDFGPIVTQNPAGIADNIATDISSDGQQMIAVTNSGTAIKYYTVLNGTYSSGTFNASYTPSNIKVAILDSGEFMIAYLAGSTTQQMYWSLNGAGPLSSPYTSYNHLSVEIGKDATFFYPLINRMHTSLPNGYIDVCRTNTVFACGFNAISAKTTGTPFTHNSMKVAAGNLYHTYIHGGLVYQNITPTSTMSPGFETQPTEVHKFVPYEPSGYTNLSVTAVHRNAPGTPLEIDYPFYNPTISGFQMKPISLKSTTMDGIFTIGFASQTN